ncbi:MAG TPA: ABC transporter permease [Nitrososphaerales archaeon]|nr:ABC transporter permease [Nitrososphaerales archaeon]
MSTILSSMQDQVESALTIAEMEARKIRHDSTELWARSIQPALWLLIFGEVFSGIRAGLAPAGFTYLQYIAPGILAQSVLFIAIFYGITVVWERDVGLLTKLMSTPSSRTSIIVGKSLASGVRGIFQAIVIFALALILRVTINLSVLSVIGVFCVTVLFAMCFACLSMFIASLLRTRERMMGIGQAITIPLFFASSAIYPLSLMPSWLRAVAVINPLTYVVDALRAILLPGYQANLLLDIAALIIATVLFTTLASVSIKRLID